VPLKILLADDSMTAQKMGKEILTGAGYEVIAVSNGAAAAKKLAEKPDVCVLDIIMPGYTGIEVCEKIRANMETAKMPVLLTVGKMEHYEQKEVQRVAADGVIVKPFEATDLLAAVEKLADQLAPKAAAAAAAASHEKTMIFTPPAIEEWKSEAEVHDETTGEVPAAKKAAAMEVPAEVASAPAFMDFGHSEPAPPPIPSGTSREKTVLITPPDFPSITAATPDPPPPVPTIEFTPVARVEESVPAAPTFDLAAAPAFEVPPAAHVESPHLTDVESAHFAALLSGSASSAPLASAPVVEQEHAIEFTAQPSVEVNPPIVGGFEATAHASVEVGQSQDPALGTGTEGFDSFRTTISTSEPPSAPKSEEDDFEARVAAAMAQLEEPAAEAVPEVEPVVEFAPEPDYTATQRISIPSEFLDAPAQAEPPERITEEMQVPVPEPALETQVIERPTEIVEHAVEMIETPSVPDRTGDTQIMRAAPDGMMDAALVEQMQAAAELPVEPPSIEDTQEIPAPVIEAAPAPAIVEPSHQDSELAKALAVAVSAEAPVAASQDTHPEEVHEIAYTVRSVFERMLPDFMEEVKKELAKRKR
jgi:CheY-like chemotaxis protein